MAATISGSGTSTLINLTTSGNTILGDASTDTLNVGNGGLVKDASGNVGIGTATPTYKLDVAQTSVDAVARIFANATTTSSRLEITNGDGTTAINYSYVRFINSKTSSQDWRFGTYGNNNLSFVNTTAGTTPMTLDSSGNLLVGTTSVNYAGSGFTLSTNSGTTKWLVGPISGTAGNFYIASSGTTGVYLNGTGATSWSSNSDERLKTDLKPIENAAEKVASLRAVTGRYKTDEEGYSRAFLIAQDVQAVLPEAVAPTTMYDGTEVLGLAYTETIPLLVAAIKEQQAIITQLQADVAALKGTA